jgi:hypothetical protein
MIVVGDITDVEEDRQYHIISFISFRRSVQDYKIGMNVEIITFLGSKK